MSIYNHELEAYDSVREFTCPKCHKTYVVGLTNQTPGFRDTEDLICPHCNTLIKQSMEYYFSLFKEKETK